jgi:NADPH-dependent ferric siderophore reductase
VDHEVTNVGNDHGQLTVMAEWAREANGEEDLTVLADRGYFSGTEILECANAVTVRESTL